MGNRDAAPTQPLSGAHSPTAKVTPPLNSYELVRYTDIRLMITLTTGALVVPL